MKRKQKPVAGFVNFWSFVGLSVFQTETPKWCENGNVVKGRTKTDNLLQDILHCILTAKILVLKLGVSCARPGVELNVLCGSLLECETVILYLPTLYSKDLELVLSLGLCYTRRVCFSGCKRYFAELHLTKKFPFALILCQIAFFKEKSI